MRLQRRRLDAIDATPRRFDGCTALLFLVLAFYIPFSIAFLDVGDFIWFDWYQLVWFSVDIMLSFCSPYENEEGWVTNPKWIAAEYFQCFFWVDTISTFPFVLVLGRRRVVADKLLKMPRRCACRDEDDATPARRRCGWRPDLHGGLRTPRLVWKSTSRR